MAAAKPLLTVAEAARMMGLSCSTGYELARAGELPGHVELLGRRYVRRAVLEAWLDGQGGPNGHEREAEDHTR